VEVLTAQEDGTAKLDDPALINRTVALRRILFSRDEDMLAEATRRQRAGESFATIVYAHQLQVSIGQCIADLEMVAKTGGDADPRGQVIFLRLG
jgi:hypothetical protein